MLSLTIRAVPGTGIFERVIGDHCKGQNCCPEELSTEGEIYQSATGASLVLRGCVIDRARRDALPC
jgi:hypothetical protein